MKSENFSLLLQSAAEMRAIRHVTAESTQVVRVRLVTAYPAK